MRRSGFLVVYLAVAAMGLWPFAALAQGRVALVVGNGDYANATRLPNPPNDAEDMAAALRELGFEVISAVNVDKAAFDLKLRDFAKALRDARMALFFYAGHGMQVAGKNYAIPLDARLESAADLPVETIDIDRVLAVMQADENRVSLVFLDACRDNPLARSFARALPATRSGGVGTGLSAVEAGRGTLIAYATAPNKVAIDGRGRNSPFTAALLRHIHTPGLDIALVMRRVTAEVEAVSGGAQVPWVHASLTTDVTLAPTRDAASDTPKVAVGIHPEPARPVPPSPRIEFPNEPLPAEVPIDPAVLRLVETNPFFANAPPVIVRSYAVSKVEDSKGGANTPYSNAYESNTMIGWLRQGIIRVDENSRGKFSTGGEIAKASIQQTTEIMAANGLILVGNTGVYDGSTFTAKMLRISNMNGRIFPVEVGNRFSYEATYQWINSGSAPTSYILKMSCEIEKKRDAKSFHLDLTGEAFILVCDVFNQYKGLTAWRGKAGQVFFGHFGIWMQADAVFAGERIVQKGNPDNLGARRTGQYTLKSFALAQ